MSVISTRVSPAVTDTQKEPPIPLPSRGTQKKYFRWFFFALFAFLLYQLILILSIFSDVIIWAGSLALVFWPAYHVIEKHLPGRPNLAASLCTSGVLIVVIVPMAILFATVIAQSASLYPVLQDWFDTARLDNEAGLMGLLPDFLRNAVIRLNEIVSREPLLAEFDLRTFLLERSNSFSSVLTNLGAMTAKNILLGIVNVILILVLMYFCFRDGRRFLAWFFAILPMKASHAEAITLRIYQMVTAIIRGALVTATVQGTLAAIGYFIAGVPLAILFGALTGFFALVPVVGAGLIWFPIGLVMLTRDPGWGIFVMIWGFFLVSMIDNLLKPILIGSKTSMPILLVFCGMIGGANVYGLTGFIIGPILISVLLACITIYQEDYLEVPGPG